jgi:glutaredoxin 3
MPIFQVYSKSNCKYCRLAKDAIKNISIATLHVVENPSKEEVQRLKGETGHHTYPFIFVDDRFIGGYSEFLDMYKNDICGNVDTDTDTDTDENW